jgi:flagellar biosynthesis chaperone FliJ
MEAIEAIDIQERIKQAVSNIETIEKEAISFSKSRKELQDVAKGLAEHIENQKTYLLEMQELVKVVKSSLVEETLVQFEKNVIKTQDLVNALYKNISENLFKEVSEIKNSIEMDYKKHSKTNLKTFVIFGVVSVGVLIANVIINLFV